MDQENTISELSSAVESFLKIQPIVKKLQGNIAKISKQVDTQRKSEVTVSKIDPEIVKPFTPPKNSMEKTVQQPAKDKSKTKPKKACTPSMILEDDEIIPEYICRESVQAMNLDELRALLYPRTKNNERIETN